MTFQFLSNVTPYFDCFFVWKLPQIQCSNFRKVVRQHELTKLSPWVWCTTLWGTVYIFS